MELEGLLPHSQKPATCPCSEPDRSNPCPLFHFAKIHFNIIHPSTPGYLKWSAFLRFPHQNFISTSPLPHTCHMPCPSQSSWFCHPNNFVKWLLFQMHLRLLCQVSFKHTERKMSVYVAIKCGWLIFYCRFFLVFIYLFMLTSFLSQSEIQSVPVPTGRFS